MVNTRSKTRKIRSILKSCTSQPAMDDDDTDHQSNQSGALVGSNDDLLTEILLRLPVTSILRFKSVSKHWRWLLSDRSFTIRFDKLSKSPGTFAGNKYVPFDVQDRSPPPFRVLDFYPDPRGIKILQSCNGLLLCCSGTWNRAFHRYYVYNPATKQFSIIPSIPGGLYARKSIVFMCLAFHQTDCVHYKLVCICRIPNSPSCQIKIYSSETRKWKVSISFSGDFPTFNKGVYWNAAIHWAPYHNHIMRFDIEVERLQTLPFPAGVMSSEASTRYLGESRGHLHLIVTIYREYNMSFAVNVYEMLGDHSGWFVKYHVELDELPGAFPEMINYWPGYCFVVVDVVRGEKEEDTFMVLKMPMKLITYNVHYKSFRHIFNLDYHLNGCLHVHRYTETLASI